VFTSLSLFAGKRKLERAPMKKINEYTFYSQDQPQSKILSFEDQVMIMNCVSLEDTLKPYCATSAREFYLMILLFLFPMDNYCVDIASKTLKDKLN
jgi:hypothetical protein